MLLSALLSPDSDRFVISSTYMLSRVSCSLATSGQFPVLYLLFLDADTNLSRTQGILSVCYPTELR